MKIKELYDAFVENRKSERRYLSRLLFKPKLQLKYGLFFMAVGVPCMIALNLLTVLILVKVVTLAGHTNPGTDISKLIITLITENGALLFAWVMTVAMGFLAVAVLLTQRIVGPLHALLKHVEEIKNGNFEYQTHLRKKDELKPLMDALNQLGPHLQNEVLKNSKSKMKAAVSQ
jgi:methyl-accepting chemotaxis protein